MMYLCMAVFQTVSIYLVLSVLYSRKYILTDSRSCIRSEPRYSNNGCTLSLCGYLLDRHWTWTPNISLLDTSCLIEENTSYHGNDLNIGIYKQPDLESCKSFCSSNYPTAKYFGYVSPDFPNKASASACRCKSSNAGRRKYNGVFAGELGCDDGPTTPRPPNTTVPTRKKTATTSTPSGEIHWRFLTLPQIKIL